MTEKNIEYIDDIVKEMLNGTFSVFCGAGADCDATKQEWLDIFTDKTREFYEKHSSDVYLLADLEKRYYNSESFFTDICDNLYAVSNLESQHINNIVNLNINQIWTTNFDSIIENTIQRKFGFSPTIIKESADLFTENLSSRYVVYKLNGCVSKPDTMVLTKSDFFDYFKKQRLLFEMLKRQLVLDSFLFIGYSFTDDLVLNALREIKEVFPNQGKIHYRFVKRKDNEKSTQEYSKLEAQYYYDKYNIRTIYISDFNDIDFYLQKLYERFCNHNVLISGSFRHLKNNDERVYIEDLIDCLVQKLIQNSFNIYSGNGRGLGEIVVAQVNKHNAEKHFVNRPLIFTNDTNEEKDVKNRLIMKDCDTMIVVGGQDESLTSSKNVINQYFTFVNNSEGKKYPLVIPIPSTGYAAQEIFNSEEFRHSNVFQTNQKLFTELGNTTEIEYIVHLLVNLIMSYKTEKV